MKVIEVKNLVKTYGAGETAVQALKGVDLDVLSGELLLLLGASGSGKTTLISIMGGILSATSGVCKIRGTEIVGLAQRKLPKIRLENIGFIFQGFNLFPALNAQENVEIALDLKGGKGGKARKTAAELLDRVGLGNKMKSHPADLSGGQKQRVAIARSAGGRTAYHFSGRADRRARFDERKIDYGSFAGTRARKKSRRRCRYARQPDFRLRRPNR